MAAGIAAGLLEGLFITGMVLFGLGFLWRGRARGARGSWLARLREDDTKHLFRAGGWAAFGFYWFALFPQYAFADDFLNALGTAVALPIFLFLAWHEVLSYRWREEYEPLRFLCGAAFFASLIYFVFDRIPPLSGAYIQVVAQHTIGMLGFLNERFTTGPIDFVGNTGWYRGNSGEISVSILDPVAQGTVVQIVLACTAIQAFAIAAALIFSTRDPPKRKALAVALIFPATYVMNLVRNTVVIHYYYTRGEDFDLVHSWYGKGLSLIVTAVLLLLAFYLLPELFVMLSGLYDLPWRKAPGWDYRSSVGSLFRKSHERMRAEDQRKPPGPSESATPPVSPKRT